MSSPSTRPERVPAHVAWVAQEGDGAAGAPPAGGGDAAGTHDAGDRTLLELVDAARALGVAWLTVQEPTGGRALRERADDLASRGVEVLDGTRGGHPDGSSRREAGASSPVLRVLVAAPRSGKEELVDAVRRIAETGATPDKVDEKVIGASLGVPDVDLLVVTGGDRRVPDLLLWQVAYSEIVFLPERWPQAGRSELEKAVAEYRRRDRRYGGLVPAR